MPCEFGELGSSAPPFYHGTTTTRQQCILKEGFKFSTGDDTPASFGRGIYFTPSLTSSRTFAAAKHRDDKLHGKDAGKSCNIKIKLKHDARIVHIDYAPRFNDERRMQTEFPPWFKPLLDYYRHDWKDWKGEHDKELAESYIEKWQHRYNRGFDESERYELAEFARAAGCDAIRWHGSISKAKKVKDTKYTHHDVILVVNPKAIEVV